MAFYRVKFTFTFTHKLTSIAAVYRLSMLSSTHSQVGCVT